MEEEIPVLIHQAGFRIDNWKPALRHPDIDDALGRDKRREREDANARPAAAQCSSMRKRLPPSLERQKHPER
jgi:hypothetical protein